MRPKSLLLLVLALGCGLIASFGISQVMSARNKQPTVVDQESIYVAIVNINVGDPIDESMVKLQDWPKSLVFPDAIKDLAEVVGRRPKSPIISGEAMREAKLLKKGQVADPIAHIPPGYRLKTVSVNAETSAAGLLNPGDRVDILLFIRADKKIGLESSLTKTILQNIKVFAIDQATGRSDEEGNRSVAKTISLLLTPKQSLQLTTAENLGKISLIPRHPDDLDIAETTSETVQDILSGYGVGNRKKEQTSTLNNLAATSEKDLPGIVEPVQKSNFSIEVITGDKVSYVSIDSETGKPIANGNNQLNGPASYPGTTQKAGFKKEKSSLQEDTISEPPIDFAS